MIGRDLLRRQLELVRFEKAIDYITGAAGLQKRLNSQELAVINGILVNSQSSPWRQEAAVIQLPSGRQETFALLSNPMFACRDLLATCSQRAREGELVAAATLCYSQLVRSHFFKDANRRTAVTATYWLLLENGVRIASLGLLEIGVGDLADPDQAKALENLIQSTVQIARDRGQNKNQGKD